MYIIADDYQVHRHEIKPRPCADIIDAEQYRRQLHNIIIDAEEGF